MRTPCRRGGSHATVVRSPPPHRRRPARPGVQQEERASAVRVLAHSPAVRSPARTARPAGRPATPAIGTASRRAGSPIRAASTDAEIARPTAAPRGSASRGTPNRTQSVAPLVPVDIVERRTGGVGGVGRVDAAAREIPDEPAVDGADEHFAAARALFPMPCCRSSHSSLAAEK